MKLPLDCKFIDNFGDREVSVSLKRIIERQVFRKYIGQAALQLINQKI